MKVTIIRTFFYTRKCGMWRALHRRKHRSPPICLLSAVSYTHLDVYKRQVIRFLPVLLTPYCHDAVQIWNCGKTSRDLNLSLIHISSQPCGDLLRKRGHDSLRRSNQLRVNQFVLLAEPFLCVWKLSLIHI